MPVKIDLKANYYETLGVSSDATGDEIKRAYRKLARQHHPDVPSGDEDTFKAIGAAYEVLSDSKMRQVYDLNGNYRTGRGSTPQHSPSEPEAKTVNINGAEVRITYYDEWGRLRATLGIFEVDLPLITVLPDLEAPVAKIIVFDEWGGMLCSGYSLNSVRSQLESARIERERARREESNEKKLVALQRQLEDFRRRDLPVDQLAEFVSQFGMKSRTTRYSWMRADEGDVLTALRSAEKEAERLKGDPTEIIRDYFLAGKITHPDIALNHEVMAAVESWVIRTNGFFEAPTDDDIRKFYVSQLAGIKTLQGLRLVDLRLRFEDYVPRDLIQDPAELGAAPAEITLNTRRDRANYPVSYGYMDVDGEPRAVGIVKVPLSTFEANAPEHGKRSSFPELPYGVLLIAEVTLNGDEQSKVIARGPVDLSLTRKVEKFKSGRRRGQAFQAADPYGFGRSAPVEGTPLPPWFRGRRPR